MAVTDFPPHPLVVAVATRLSGDSLFDAKQAAVEAQAAADAAAAVPPSVTQAATAAVEKLTAPRAGAKARDAFADQTRMAAANTFAVNANLPELTAFAGFLGGTMNQVAGHDGFDWQLLYLDGKLLTWLIVQRENIVFHQRLADDTAPFNQRDVIWVRADAPLARSTGSPALWLSGAFTSAADFTAPLAGGTAPEPATGIFCEARSPDCCPPQTRSIKPCR